MRPALFQQAQATQLQLVTLKNGAQVPQVLVVTTMMNLTRLINSNPIAFYELVQKCRDNNHQMFGNTKEIAVSLALMDRSGSVHRTVKDVVLSAVQGDDFDMTLGNPIAPVTAPSFGQ